MAIWKRLRRVLTKNTNARIDRLGARLDRDVAGLRLQIGDLQARRVRALPDRSPLWDAEFSVSSQFGDDGILQYLFSRIPAVERFVEFGVEDYREANTRFLLQHDNWSGLILDSHPDLDTALLHQGLTILHDLTARSAFITAENIDGLIADAGFGGEIGLLSLDIDGNEYWVWKAIECARPQVVVTEYNCLFGAERSLTVPYDPAFERFAAHWSGMLCGASLPAFYGLAAEKGYAFVGCNSAGNNAYFVRRDLAAPFRVLRVDEGFVENKFRDTRDADGRFTRLAGRAKLELIADAEVIDLESGKPIRLREIG